MNRKTSMAFMMEYLVMILVFICFFAVNTGLIVKAYQISDLADHKRLALEYINNILEESDTDFVERIVNEDFMEDINGEYLIKINDVLNKDYKEIEIFYKDTSLFKLPFIKGGLKDE